MSKFRGFVVGSVAAAAALAGVVGMAPPVQALSAGLAFSADSSSTWQADGVAYAVATSGTKVVIGGTFTQVRPPVGGSGTALSTPGLAILNADSGSPDSCQLPAALSGGTPAVYAVNTSPDGKTVYVGGNFSSIGGVAVNRVAAIDVATCAVKPLRVSGVSSVVYGLTSTASTLYLAGAFSQVAGQPRASFAAVNATTGALLPFVADADKTGRAMAVSPDGSKLAIGGDFFAINGTYSHSIAVVDATTGANIRNYPAGFIPDLSVTKAIASDGSSFYVGNEGTGGGVFDGRIAIDWSTLDQRWRDTCLGATQAVLPYQGILYSANHAHDCSSIGYYPNGVRKYFIAESTSDRTFRGWTPTANDGIGEGIGPRGLAIATGASGAKFMYAVGEFTQINGVAQQSFTRFGTNDLNAPPAPFIQAEALTSNAIQVRAWTPVDNDDDTLTYSIYRNGSTTPIWTGQATSWWWSRPQITFTDKTVTPGTSYTYKVKASDATSSSAQSGGATATAVTKAVDYPAQVLADGPALYWRFDEPSGTWTWDKAGDSTAALNGLLNRGVALGSAGAIGSNTAATFDGKDDFAWNDRLRPAPSVYTEETWIKTTTTAGGKIIGYSDGRPYTDSGQMVIPAVNVDRHVYMDNSGRLNFGTYNGTNAAVVRSSKAYNDGTWHHIVASQNADGMVLYVDGARVGRNTRSTASNYVGIWKVGGDKLAGWPNKPTSDYFAGQIDDTAVYEGKVLSASDVVKHYQLSGRTTAFNAAPGNAYGSAVFNSDPELYWPLSEASGPAEDKSMYGQRPGTVGAGVTRRTASTVGDTFGITTTGGTTSTVATGQLEPSLSSWSAETWFKTGSTTGGKLIGFENTATGSGTSFDKHLYLTNAGAVVLGVSPSGRSTITSAAGLNNNQWHHVVGTQGTNGLKLYVDGVQVASTSLTTNQSYDGYWRVGGGNLTNWPSRPTSDYFTGSLDEAAVYDHALSATEIANHYNVGKSGAAPADTVAPSAPTNVAAVPSGSDVALSWTASTDNVGVVKYDIYRGTSSGFTPSASNKVGETAGVTFSDTSTLGAGSYYYVVKARDAADNVSPASAEAPYVQADTVAPSTPANVAATSSGGDVAVSWDASTDNVGVVKYDVYRGTTAGFTPGAANKVGEASGATYSDTSTLAAGDYYYVVKARDAAGNVSGASDAAHYVKAPAADTQAPSAPANVAAVSSGSNVAVSWNASTDNVGVTAYDVYRGTTAGFTPGAANKVGEASGVTYSDTSTLAAGDYYYVVKARDAAGNVSAASDAAHYVKAGSTQTVTVTLPAVADTMVAENNKAGNYGTNNQLSSRAPGSASELQSYLRYDLSGIPAGARLVSAKLKVTTSNDSTAGTTGVHRVKSLTGSWSEASTVWTNRPTGVGATLGEFSSAPQINTSYTTDLDASAFEVDSGSVSFALVGISSDNLRINSREATNSAVRPTLTVTYEQ